MKKKTTKKKPTLLSETVTFSGKTVEDFLEQADVLRACVSEDNASDDLHPHASIYAQIDHYSINKKGMTVYTSGENVSPICYGSIIITDEIHRNNGAGDPDIYFRVEGITQGGVKLQPVTVPAADFASLNWITKAWGSSIVVTPTQTAKQKLAAGILLTGERGDKRTVYTHTGYLFKDNKPIDYISAAGSLLKSDIQSEIEHNLSRYQLAGVSHNVDERAGAIKASLSLLDAHASEVTAPLFAFVYLAPILPIVKDIIGETSFCLYLQGKTQSGKSTLAALAASHFGNFESMTPPTSFASTANYINELAFILKDCILWVDDYHPQGTPNEAKKQDQIFQTIARAAGDHSTRGRLNSSAQLQNSHPPRCLFLVTGEDVPKIGQSGSARVFTLEVTRTRKDISALQHDARNGVLSRAMSDYIKYVISRFDELKSEARGCFEDISKALVEKYGACRLANQAALLCFSALLFLDYAVKCGALTDDKSMELYNQIAEHIQTNASNKEKQLKCEDPAEMFITAIRDLISSGRRTVHDLETCNREYAVLNDREGVIGWKDSKGYYLDSNASYTAVYDYYSHENRLFNCTSNTLHKQLREAGYVIPNNQGGNLTQKRINANTVVRCLLIPLSVFDD